MTTLQEAVRLISSDKVKERAEGIEQYRDIFQDEKTLRSLTEGDEGGKRWLKTMQALFICVINDKAACMKKGSLADAAPVSLRRLKESAQTMQWTVEKAHRYYPQPAFMAVFKHLTQMLDDRGRLFEPLAVEYIKALRTLLSYRPHLEHLDPSSWRYVTTLCFNILLGESLKADFDDGQVGQLFSSQESPPTSTQRPSRLLDAEVASCLHILVSSSYAPLLGTDRLGVYVLDRYASFLSACTNESTAHLPILQGLNAVLSELDINESAFVCELAVQAWSPLLSLWATKSRQLKEQLIIAFTILLPSLTSTACHADRISRLFQRLLDEASQRFALSPLSLSALELSCRAVSHAEVFGYSDLCPSCSFSSTDTQTWAALELAADCAISLYKSGTTLRVDADDRPTKRQRQDQNGTMATGGEMEVIQLLVNRITGHDRVHDHNVSQLWALQTLLFVALRFSRHPDASIGWISDTFSIVIDLSVSAVDPDAQSWSLLIIAALARYPAAVTHCKLAWPTIVRKITQSSGTTRAAAHAATELLAGDVLQQKEISTELDTFWENLELQSPSLLCDSVLAFLTEALSARSGGISTAKTRQRERTLSWLQTVLLVDDGRITRREGVQQCAQQDIVRLLAEICSLSLPSGWPPCQSLLPESSLVTHMQKAADSSGIRSFVLSAALPSGKQLNERLSTQPTKRASRSATGTEMRCLQILQNGLKAQVSRLEATESLLTCTVEQMQQAASLVATSLLFNGALESNGVTLQKELLTTSHSLLHTIAQSLMQPRWRREEIARTLAVLAPVLISARETRAAVRSIEPSGSQSGVTMEASQPIEGDDVSQSEAVMRSIWPSSSKIHFLQPFLDILLRFFSNQALPASEVTSAARIEDAIWSGDQRQHQPQGRATDTTQSTHTNFIVHVCLSALINIPRWAGTPHVGLEKIKDSVFTSPTNVPVLITFGPLMLAESDFMQSFTAEELQQLMEIIGDDVMAEYEHSNSVEAQLLAIDGVNVVLLQPMTLATQDLPIAHALKLANFFVKQLIREALHWQVELQLAAFLQRFLAAALTEGSRVSNVKYSSLSPESIATTITTLNARRDIRVRWAASAMSARLFPIWAQLGLDSLQLYGHVESALPKDTSSIEMMATRNLVLANTLVASSRCRHIALYHLLELPLVEDRYNSFTRVCFHTAAQCLGFPSTRQLWLLFATQFIWAVAENKYKIDRIPFDVLGYASQQEMLSHSFLPVASMLAAMDTAETRKELRTLVNLAGKTEKEGLLTCLPFLTATELSFVVGASAGSSDKQFNAVVDELARKMHLVGDQRRAVIAQAMASSLDAIVVNVLRLFYEADLAAFSAYLKKSDPIGATLLTALDLPSGPALHEPCKPHSDGVQIHRSFVLLIDKMPETIESATVYSAVRRMAHLVYDEKLVNDQNRHLQALKLYLALVHKTVEADTNVLRLLLHSLAVLMGQARLVAVLWPVWEWAAGLLKSFIPGVSASFLLLLRHAQRFTRTPSPSTQDIGKGISDKLGVLVQRLKDMKGVKNIALEVICAWPGDHPSSLAKRRLDIDVDKLTRAFHATSTVSSTLVDRFCRALEKASAGQLAVFSSCTIWTILACLEKAEVDELEQGQIAESLANVLYLCHGVISCPGDAEVQRQIADRQYYLSAIEAMDTQSMQPLKTLKSWVAWRLLLQARSPELGTATRALHCLRVVLTQEAHLNTSFATNDSQAQDEEEVLLIRAFPATATLRKKRSRVELEGEEAVRRGTNYEEWLRWLCTLLIDLLADKEETASLSQMVDLFGEGAKSAFAAECFPALLHMFLRSDLVHKVKQRQDTKAISHHLTHVLRRPQTDARVWRAVLEAIIQLRHDCPGEDPLDSDRWVWGLDYLVLQRRAAQCKLYAAAILFAELEQEHQRGKSAAQDDNQKSRLALQYDIYSNIEDPDSFYGVRNPDVRDSFLNRLQHEGQWHRLFDFQAAHQEASEDVPLTSLAPLLHHQGLHKLSLHLDEQQATAYSAAWRKEEWDLPVDTLHPGTSQTLYAALRAVHREAVAEAVKMAIQRSFQTEFHGIVGASMESNNTTKASVRDLLGLREARQWQLGSMQLISDRFAFDEYERLMTVRMSLLRSQSQRGKAKQIGDTYDQETINLIARECSVLISLSQEARRNQRVHVSVNAVTRAQQISRHIKGSVVEEEFANLLWHLGDHATAIDSLHSIIAAHRQHVAAAAGEKASPTKKKDEARKEAWLPLALARLGQWRSTARSHQPLAIKEECFQPAIAMLDDSTLSSEQRALVMFQSATFAHEQYQQLLRSSEGSNLSSFIRYRREEIDQLELQMKRSGGGASGSGSSSKAVPVVKLARAKDRAEKILAMDVDKLEEFEHGKTGFRKMAMRMYAKTLTATEGYNDKAVIRLISLWFESAQDEELNSELRKWLVQIPSRKFLPFAHQLSSRLSSSSSLASSSSAPPSQGSRKTNGVFQSNVRETVLRMSMEHPFHSLAALYALSRVDDDKDGRKAVSQRQGPALLAKGRAAAQTGTAIPLPQLLRKEAALSIISHVASNHPQPQRIREWKQVCDACVEWARFDLQVQMPSVFGPGAADQSGIRAKAHAISSSFNLAISRIRDVDVPVLTSHLAVDVTCKYDSFISIACFSNRFTTAGGVHLPKISDCIGSDGKAYKQLFKNRDDLRQDAVMQQVFGVLNGLLATDRETERRQLRVRTYTVIPLGPQYGLLEFVGNTRPIQAALLATHKKYRRQGEITPAEARAQLHKYELKGRTAVEQGQNFDAVCAVFPPKFRYHFLESHKVPLTLLTSRLNYTRSVATNSIVGHILGLGDRHVSNILLDDTTGEVVNIDFGVAFDQGKLLPIPELVPFRLTRDLVDGMGLHGVEGVYRRCCQETLRVMREGASVIETVLQVFRYDPLYDWTQNPVKVIRAQVHASQGEAASISSPTSSEMTALEGAQPRRMLPPRTGAGMHANQPEEKDVAELLAERAISTVMDKLSTVLSVEHTVNDLIMQARDSKNLGAIFSGWQAAL